MARAARHQDKDVRKAIVQAQGAGWQIEPGKNHRWGTLKCGRGCKLGVWRTPKDPVAMAKRIREAVRGCPHQTEDIEWIR